MSAALSLTDCPTCQGEGFVFVDEGKPSESLLRCYTCGGSGTLEVCASCGEALTIEAGLETCSCVRAQVAA